MIKRRTLKIIIISVGFSLIAGLISALIVSHLSVTQTPPTEYYGQESSNPTPSSLEDKLPIIDEGITELHSEPSEFELLPNVSYNHTEHDELSEDNVEEQPLEAEDFSFENGIEGLEYLEKLLLDYIEPLWGNYSIYVKNLDTNEYLIVNHRQQTAASLIKLFNFVYAFEKIENGSLEKTSAIEQWLYESIVISCNNSYNHLLSAIGYGNVVQGAMDTTEFTNSRGFEDTVVGGTLHPSYFTVVGFSNVYTSVLDVGHLLENIYRGTMVSEEASYQMLEILLAQQRLNKIPAGLPEGTVTASKTGEIGALEHDAAIVFAESANYIIVIMTENASSAHFNIQEISRLVYNYFLEFYESQLF